MYCVFKRSCSHGPVLKPKPNQTKLFELLPDRIANGQVSVQREQYQGVDRPVGGGVDQVLHQLAPGAAERPPDETN